MKEFLKKYLKNIILAVVIAAAVIVVGILNINNISEVEARKASYTRTQFDITISSPDKAQVQELEKQASAEKVFPVYAYKNAFSSFGKNGDINLLLADDMQNYGISLFTENTCVAGEYSQSGIMLDNLASERLGVNVGDSLSYTVSGRKITGTVSAVYLTSTYGTLTDGIVLAPFPAELESVKPRAYGMAFVKASDVSAMQTYLSDYVGEGVLTTYEEYIASYTRPPYQTEEEFEAQYRPLYEAAREAHIKEIKNSTANAQVTLKSAAYELVQGRVNIQEKNITTMNILVTVAAAVLFAIVSVIFTVTNKKNDKINCEGGMKFSSMFGAYALSALITAAAVAVISLIALFIAATQTFFLAECVKTVMLFSLSALMAVPAIVLCAFVYVKLLYKNSAEI